MVRHDPRLTGRASAKGKIAKPVIKDKLFAGAYEGLAVVRPDSSSMTVTAGEQIDPDYWTAHASEWNTDGALATPESQGFTGCNGGFVKLIPDLDGPQKLEFEGSTFRGEPRSGYLYAYDQPNGERRVVWQTEPEQMLHGPTVILTDADGDGIPEVVVAFRFRVMVYDSRTGAKKTQLQWHDMRNYGFLGCFRAPGERFPKFVVIADFASHMDVLDNDGQNLSILWRKDLEHTILCKEKITRIGPNPIADIDGDGRIEITISLFNYADDQQWHVISFDALTGDIRFDIPNAYACGIADINGDGLPELFIQDTTGPMTPRFGPIRLISLRDGEQKALWSHERAAWQTTELIVLPFTSNTMAIDGRRTVFLADSPGGRLAFAVIPDEDGRESLISIGRGPDGKWAARSTITGPSHARLGVKAVRSSREDGPELLVSWRPDGDGVQELQTKGACAEVVSYRSMPGPIPAPIAATLRKNEPPTLIFQNGAEQIAAYQKIESGWKLRWKTAGRGMTNEGRDYFGVIAADVDGDGDLETVFTTPAPSGEAQIVAVGPDGEVKWRRAFPGFDGGVPIHNMAGLTMWNVGHFTSRKHLDVFVNVRRSTMHSFEGYLLCGVDGHVIWRHGVVEIPGTGREDLRGYGGLLTAAADVNGDGLDELICENPDRFWVASGRTGEIEKIVGTDSGTFPDMWVAYGTPVVADFHGTGGLQVLWGGCNAVTALLDTDGKPIWYGDYLDGSFAFQGIANADETGKPLIGGAGYNDGFRCLDSADGKVLWTYPLTDPGPSGHTITADVESDGTEEFVFAHGKTLYALNGKGGKANLVWSIELPANPGPLAYADADGDGKPEIVFGASDGYVYLIGE